MQFRGWWRFFIPSPVAIPSPTLSGELEPFTVRGSHNRVSEIILRSAGAALVLAFVAFLVLYATTGNSEGYGVAGMMCALVLIPLDIVLYTRAQNVVEVGKYGLLVGQGSKSRSILWDQLIDVSIETARGPHDEALPHIDQLVLRTSTGDIRPSGAHGLCTTRGRMRQLAATIRNYRSHVLAGTANWIYDGVPDSEPDFRWRGTDLS
jgi:hypothetical protein